jgi:hypothetical protein
VLTQVNAHDLRDEEFLGPIRTTRWSVVSGEIGLERCLSSCAIICTCASANFVLAVENDPDRASVASGSAEVEAGGETASRHGGGLVSNVAAATIEVKDSSVTKSLPAIRTS